MSDTKLIVCTLLLTVLAVPCEADLRQSGTVRGRVTNRLSRGVPGVTVIPTNIQTLKEENHAVTDQNGEYQLPLPVGTYTLEFEKPGFETGERSKVVVVLDQTLEEVNIQLKIDPRGGKITGNISGTITDQQGAVMVGVAVTATNQATFESRTTQSGAAGEYRFSALQIGRYNVEVTANGFKKTLKIVDVGPNQTSNGDMPLESGAVTQQVTVTGSQATVASNSAATETILTQQIVEQLPLPNRSLANLALLSPGVTSEAATNSSDSRDIHVNGSRADAVDFAIDGLDNNHASPAQELPFGTIAELKIGSHSEARLGRYAGGIVNAATKGGTDSIHGSIFYFHRNSQLAARDFFDAEKSHSLLNQFGTTLGGPIVKDKTFLFGAFDGTRDLEARPRVVSVPSQSRHTSARSILSARQLAENPLSTQLLRLFPSPDRGSNFNNLTIDSSAINDRDSFMVRIGHSLNSNSKLDARYNLTRSDQLFPMAPSFLPGFRTDLSGRAQAFAATVTTSITPRLVNEASFTYHREREDSSSEDRGLNPSSLGLNTGVSDPGRFGLPFIKITGFDALGSPVDNPLREVADTWQVRNELTYARVDHTFVVGFDFRRQVLDSRDDSGTRGRIIFNGSFPADPLSDFLAGKPAANTAIVRGDTQRNTAVNSIDWFAQDNIRPSSNFVVTLGLRYNFDGILHDEKNRLSNFLPEAGLVQAGTPQLPKLYNNDRNNFAPRVGFSWDPSRTGRLAIRASWGIFYNSISPNRLLSLGPFANSLSSGIASNPAGPSPVFVVRAVGFGPGVPIFGSPSDPPPPFDIFAIERGLKTPYAQNFHTGVQYEILRDTVLDISYVGSLGAHLYRVVDLNQPSPGDPVTAEIRRPFRSRFPQFRSIDTLLSAASSNYHSLRTSVRRNLSKGLWLNASWVFSKSIDDASIAGELPQDSRNPRAERALSSFDRRHRFVASWLYQFHASDRLILEGWQISGVFQVASGTPLTPVFSFDNSGTAMFGDRPNQVAKPAALTDRTELFNPQAFSRPPTGSFGNVGRNSLIGPGLNDLDISVLKNTMLPHGLRLELRADVFNLFNRPNFEPPNMIIDDPAFGRVSATDPLHGRRRIQLGARILF